MSAHLAPQVVRASPAWEQVGALQTKINTQLGLTGNIDIKDELLIRSNIKSKIDFRR